MPTSVLALARNGTHAEEIVDALRNAGVSSGDISVLIPQGPPLVGSAMSGVKTSTTPELTHTNKAPEGATAGASAGGIIGGTLGLLAGIGILAIPGVGPFIAAGPIMAALGGLGLGAAVGGVTGGLIGLGIPEIEAKKYESRLSAGAALISVEADTVEHQTRALAVLRQHQAEDIRITESKLPRTREARAGIVDA